MNYGNPLVLGLLATALAGAAGAETIAVGNRIEVKTPTIATPTRGMTMDEVMQRFGAPSEKLPSIDNPPITRWKYPGFTVYFEARHVIDCVVAG